MTTEISCMTKGHTLQGELWGHWLNLLSCAHGLPTFPFAHVWAEESRWSSWLLSWLSIEKNHMCWRHLQRHCQLLLLLVETRAWEGLQFLINFLSNADRKEEQDLIVLLNKKDKHLSLNLVTAHPGDSVTYFCVASAQCSPGNCCMHANLWPRLETNKFSTAGNMNFLYFVM